MTKIENGRRMFSLAKELFPICRSITGDGVRKTLAILRREIPEITVHEVPSGTKVFDWTIPREWNIKGGGIWRMNGEKVIDFADTNLHIMGYSAPIDKVVTRAELESILYTIPEQPDAIPYVTSYYKERSGFCMSENQKKSLTDDEYYVKIDSELKDGFLTYGEIVIPGETDDEVFFSTYVCHPSMANNELSGPVLASELIKYIKSLPNRRFTYRFVFVPETIGSITYLSRNADYIKHHVKCGFNLSCVGDNREYSYIESPYADTLADRVALNILRNHTDGFKRYTFLQRGSDERQYCSPGINLPLVAICRSKYGEYPEYHTSLDNLDNVVTPEGLQGSYDVYKRCIDALEYNRFYKVTVNCEPQLGKRGLYPSVSFKGSADLTRNMTNFIAYANGKQDLISISDKIGTPIEMLIPIVNTLIEHKLITSID